jgi:hypothetical protein
MSNLINDSYLGLAYISVAKNYDKVKWFVEYLPLKIHLWMCLDKLDPK